MNRYRYPRYNRPQHPVGAWFFLGVGCLLAFIGMLNFHQSKSWPTVIFSLGCIIGNFASMYMFPWYATKHVLRDKDREIKELERD